MNIFNLLTMLGGLALFLYGMDMMGDGLKKTSGGKLEAILERLTSNPLKGALLGAGVTAIIQSSSATTVMVVGFVNSGIMKLEQAVGIIMGANIGTTITSWLLSLTGIQGDSLWIKMLEPSSFSPIFAITGVICVCFSTNEKKKNIGTIILGFAVIMFGMDMMSSAVAPLAEIPEFTEIMTMFSHPVLGLLAGLVLTAVIQSSSASVGILQTLCLTGTVSYGIAIPIIMGQNIGTCITAILASLGTSKNSKRAAFIHLSFNVIGTFIFMFTFYLINGMRHFDFLEQSASVAGIAVIHSTFNIMATILLLPFSHKLVTLAHLVLPDKNEAASKTRKDASRLDELFLKEPAYAVAQADKVADKLMHAICDIGKYTFPLLLNYQKGSCKIAREKIIRILYELQQLKQYLMQISNEQISIQDNQTVNCLLQSSGELTRICYQIINIAEIAKKLWKQKSCFSPQAQKGVEAIYSNTNEMLTELTLIFAGNSSNGISHCRRLEHITRDLIEKEKKEHIKRLRKGKCTDTLGVDFLESISSFEQILILCTYIAENVKQMKD